MSRGEDEERDAPAPGVVRSDGEDAARAYVEAEVPEESHTPTLEMFRVQVNDPRHAATMRREDMLRGSGPRAPEQTVLRVVQAPGIEAPMGRAADKMQPLHFDPEFLTELRRKRGEGEGEGDPGDAEETLLKAPGSPWAQEAPRAEAVSGSALPSSLGPRDVAALVSEKSGSAPVRERPKTRAAIGVVLAVVVVAVVVRMATRGRTPVSGVQGPAPAPAATMTVGAATVVQGMAPASPQPSAEPVAPPKASATGAPALPHSAAAALERPHVAPKPSRDPDDPYADAAPVKIVAAPTAAAPSIAPAEAPTAPPVVAPKPVPAVPAPAPPSSPFLHRKTE